MATDKKPFGTLSIFYELDNAGDLEHNDVRACLLSLVRSIDEARAHFDICPDIIILLNDAFDERRTRDLVSSVLPKTEEMPIRLVDMAGTSYCEKKGIAPYLSEAEFLIMADSDCMYDLQWLTTILDRFLQGDVDAVFGKSYAKLGSLTENISAAAWVFPVENQADPFLRQKKIVLNNLAVKRAAMLEVPLPRHPATRLQGGMWVSAMRAAGKSVAWVEASCHHQQYTKLLELYGRAFRHGVDSDWYMVAVKKAPKWKRFSRAVIGVWRYNLRFFRRAVHIRETLTTNWLQYVWLMIAGAGFQISVVAGQLYGALTNRPVSLRYDYDDLLP